jgi:hypothetical protein
VAAPGDISSALNQNPDVYATYTLSLGHMGDLTLKSFAYLRVPLMMAGVAFLVGAVRRLAAVGYRGGADDGDLFSCGPSGAGDVRSLSWVAPAG